MWITIEGSNLEDDRARAVKNNLVFRCSCGGYMTRFDQKEYRCCIDCARLKGLYIKKTSEEVDIYNSNAKIYLN